MNITECCKSERYDFVLSEGHYCGNCKKRCSLIEKPKEPPKCIQCGTPMLESYGNHEWSAPFCSKPVCPNYSLLQTGINPPQVIL